MERYWVLLFTIPTWSRRELILSFWYPLAFLRKEYTFFFFFFQFVFVFLIILTSGLQYLVQRINYKRDLGRIESIVSKAKAAAWGPKMIPINGKRKV
jgi:hypothetical protein